MRKVRARTTAASRGMRVPGRSVAVGAGAASGRELLSGEAVGMRPY
jgi:hypothetical protein